MLVTQKDTITKITGIITPESIDTLKNKLGGAFTILKSTHFNEGQRYGFLAMVIPQAKYQIVINDPTWVYTAPGNPGVYAAAALGANVSAAQCKQIMARHKEEQRRMPTTSARRKQAKNSCSTAWVMMLLHP